MRRSEGDEEAAGGGGGERGEKRQRERRSGRAEIEERKKIEKSRSFPLPPADVLEFNRALQDELYSLYFSFFLYRSIYPPIPSVFFLSPLSISR